MKYYILASPVLALSVLAQAADFKADLSMGLAANAVHVVAGEAAHEVNVNYAAPVADLGLIKTIQGPLSAVVRLRVIWLPLLRKNCSLMYKFFRWWCSGRCRITV